MDDLIVPCAGVFRDNNLREDISLEKLATSQDRIRKVRARHADGGQFDAAHRRRRRCAALVARTGRRSTACRCSPISPMRRHAANDFVAGEGLLMAPTIAVSKMLDRAGLKLQDFDFYEIHEAFAAQVLCTLKAWEDPEYCQRFLGKDAPAGLDRSGEAQRQGLVASRSGILLRPPARASSPTSPSSYRFTAAAG